MPPTADIATPDRFRQPGLALLLTPILLVATWMIAQPHRGAAHRPVLAGLAADR